MWLALALAQLHGEWPQGLPWDYAVRYAVVPGQRCAHKMPVAFATTATPRGPLYLHECQAKCTGPCAGGEPTGVAVDRDGQEHTLECFCDGHCPDDGRSDCDGSDAGAIGEYAVCGSQELCQALCDADSECYGVEMSTASSRCFLLYASCQEDLLKGTLEATTQYDYLAKLDPENRGGQESCPLGLAVDADYLPANACDLNDQYEPDAASLGRRYAATCSELQWSADGCGWSVLGPAKEVVVPEPEPEPCLAETCADDGCAASWIFAAERWDAPSTGDLCATIEPWLAESYCKHAVFEALCPRTCGVPCATCTAWAGHNEAAAAILASAMGLERAGGQRACAVLRPHCDIVIERLCGCELPAADRDPDWAFCTGARARALAASPVQAPHARVLMRALEERRLSTKMEAFYTTWDPTSRPSHCLDIAQSSFAPPNEAMLNPARGVYDLKGLAEADRKVKISPECPEQPSWTTTPGHCRGNNLDISEVAPHLTEHLCWTKCEAHGTKHAQAGPDAYCDGSDLAFTPYTNALCVPREQCEALCDATEGCGGIEMHRTKPRCYLTTGQCAERLVGDYDTAVRSEAPVAFRTHTKRTCGGALALSGPLELVLADACGGPGPEQNWTCAARPRCEQLCAASAACAGFDLAVGQAKCRFRAVSEEHFCSDGAMTFEGRATVATLGPYDPQAGWEYVEKRLVRNPLGRYHPPCVARVEGHEDAGKWAPAEGQDCPGLTYAGHCYYSPSGEYRLGWAGRDFDESSFGLNRNCEGWVLQRKRPGGFATLQATFPWTTCEAPQAPALGTYTALYRWSPRFLPAARLQYVCASYPSCGLLQTCVVARARFEKEERIQRESAAFSPKTLVTVEKAKAWIGHNPWEWGQDLYRNVPGHLRVQVSDVGRLAEAELTLASAAAGNALGVHYEVPAGYEPWFTDVLRVERRGSDGEPLGVDPMKVRFYAPIEGPLQVFYFACPECPAIPVPTTHAVPAKTRDGDERETAGWWEATLARDGDYVGTSAFGCPRVSQVVLAKHPKAGSCKSLRHGDSCALECPPGSTAAGRVTCELGVVSVPACTPLPQYAREEQTFRLGLRSRTDYGWRILRIEAFEDLACTAPLGLAVTAAPAAQPGFPMRADGTGEYWTQELHANPFEVDDSHGGALGIDFGVRGVPQCVKVVQQGTGPEGEPRQYYPSKQSLSRGWATNPRQRGPAEDSPVSQAGWTEVWTSSAEAGPAGLATTTFRTVCGLEDTIIYGELLEVVHNVEAGASAGCYCKQLCIDRIQDGCVSWKLDRTKGACYLQTSIRSIEKVSESCELGSWLSGDTGIRILDADHASAGGALDVRLGGVNLPAEWPELRAATASRQRIKLVEQGQACAEGALAAGVEGLRCPHQKHCTPKPTISSGASAAWHGLEVRATAEARHLTVCYNRGILADRWEWHAVGAVEVAALGFRWTTEPAVVKRGAAFSLTVEGPAFAMADNSTARVKIVRGDCRLDGVDGFLPAPDLAAAAPDEGAFDGSSATWHGVGPGPKGAYAVCFSHDGGSFVKVAGAAMLLDVLPADGDDVLPRAVFHGVRLSGRSGREHRFALPGYELPLPTNSKLRFGCGAGTDWLLGTFGVDAASTKDQYTFAVDLTGYAAGEHDACFCDAAVGDCDTAGGWQVVGLLAVAGRVDVAQHWVLAPGEPASLEVLGDGLDWRTDRLMVIPSTGVCGLTEPVDWHPSAHSWVAEHRFEDQVPHPFLEVAEVEWRQSWVHLGDHDGGYCAGRHLPTQSPHRCHAKCAVETCEGAACFCDGLFAGYDGADSQALCLDRDACLEVCAETEGCHGIDMHNDRARCFLNAGMPGGSCDSQIVAGVPYTSPTADGYTLWFRARDRRLGEDHGHSWGEILRFTAVSPDRRAHEPLADHLPVGGEYTACFCERAACRAVGDYGLEIGHIHVSGVHCLAADPRFQRGTCVPQFHGGLRCYAGAAPELAAPDVVVPMVPAPADAAAPTPAPTALSSWCMYGPEEETRRDPRCSS